MTTGRDVNGAISHFYLKFDGQDAPVQTMRRLREVSVESSLHLPDVATVIFRDPQLELIDDDVFRLGATLQVSTRVAGVRGELFDGEIVEIEPRFTQHDQFLVIRAFDRLHRLARGTCTRSFQNVSDMDLVRKIAGEVGLSAETGSATFVHDYVFQNNQTNLAFLQQRAAQLGYLLYVDGTRLLCVPPKGEGEAVRLKWGVNLSEFLPRLSSLNQHARTMTRSWDPKTKQAILGQAAAAEGAPSVGEKRTSEDVTQAFGAQPVHTVTQQVVRQQGLADAFAQAAANRAAERLIEASGVCGGNPAITAGVPLSISAVGERFSGTYYVSTAVHSYQTDSGYTTEFQVSGQHTSGIAAALGVGRPETAQRGLAVGIVTNNHDPEGWGRVKVKYPGLTEDHESDWARVASVGGGDRRGLMALPEVNDEVIVGFEMGDIHHPYVLGGLWNGADAPPRPNAAIVKGGKVIQRLLRSRRGHQLTFDDSEESAFVQLQSARGHRLTFSDKAGDEHILIEDRAGNRITLATPSNTLTVDVAGDVKVNARGGVNLQAMTSLKAQAPNIELNGSASVKITGGVVEVQGGLIKLN